MAIRYISTGPQVHRHRSFAVALRAARKKGGKVKCLITGNEYWPHVFTPIKPAQATEHYSPGK